MMTTRNYFTYDLETYPNCFTYCGKFTQSNDIYLYEISDRKNEINELLTHLSYLRNLGIEMVGFNNIGFDYPILHELMVNPYTFNALKAHQLANKIIHAQRMNVRISRLKPSERMMPQIDIFKVCHFDNRAKATSLKALQFAMRSSSVDDLPFDLRDLTHQEMQVLCDYNVHDVTETEKFFLKNEHLLNMRREFLANGILRGDVLNHPDTKLGAEYFISKLGRAKCYNGGKPKQTYRELIEFKNIILPSIFFKTNVFNETFDWFKKQYIYIKKKDQINPKLEVDLAGLEFHFGVGGVHASAENKVFHTDDEYQVLDIDVTGMYPAVAIANNFAPEHLGQSFVTAYKQIVADRARHKKGTSMNAALKLASNGVYGNSGNVYSPFYDPQYMFSVTVNGQLQILQLVETISLIPDLEMIQANTDGVTVRIKKDMIPLFNMWCTEWENMTGLKLEHVEYNRMWIRDVNNYISETMDGKLKRKGAYWYPLCEKDYEGVWNKDFSNLASKMAAEKLMTHSWSVDTGLHLVTDSFDFMMRYKATGGARLFIGDVEQLKTVRYYVSTAGEQMKKFSKPKGEIGQYKRASKLTDEYFETVMKEIGKDVHDERIHTKNKSKYGITETKVQAGWKVKQCNVATDFNWKDVDWKYYTQEAKKNIIGSK